MKHLIILAALAVAGCELVDSASEKAFEFTAPIVREYCKASEGIRNEIRARADAAYAPHRVRVECAE